MVVSDISLSVDMKDGKEGTSQIKITPDMVRAPYGATVVQVSPSQFQVTLVPRHQLASPAG
jgi:hypothetical protein